MIVLAISASRPMHEYAYVKQYDDDTNYCWLLTTHDWQVLIYLFFSLQLLLLFRSESHGPSKCILHSTAHLEQNWMPTWERGQKNKSNRTVFRPSKWAGPLHVKLSDCRLHRMVMPSSCQTCYLKLDIWTRKKWSGMCSFLDNSQGLERLDF